jgi:hypothetical protein
MQERAYDPEQFRVRFMELHSKLDPDLCFVINPLFTQAFRLWKDDMASPHSKKTMSLTDVVKFGDVAAYSLHGRCTICVVFGKAVIMHERERSLIPNHEEAGEVLTAIALKSNDGEAIAELVDQFENFVRSYGLEKLMQETKEHLTKACFGYKEAFHPAIIEFYSL